jgi:hypothetical protein
MLDEYIDYVKKYTYEMFLIGSIIVLLMICLYSLFSSSDGSWTTKRYYELLPIKETPDYKPAPSEVGDSEGEIECRRVLNSIFDRPFHKDRPEFLNNPVTGGRFNLELDCVNHDMKIACEYNGAQHYKYIPYFHQNKHHFQTQKYRDEMKRRMCTDEGYLLIEVPYTTKKKDIENFIRTELSKAGRL